jgi:hypothetical protein
MGFFGNSVDGMMGAVVPEMASFAPRMVSQSVVRAIIKHESIQPIMIRRFNGGMERPPTHSIGLHG